MGYFEKGENVHTMRNIDWIVRFFYLYLNMMDCKMDAKGVTPMPVAIKTA